MSRRRRAEKRQVLPDPKFGDLTVTKFMNYVMYEGKKAVAENILYGAFDILEAKRKDQTPLETFHAALENVAPGQLEPALARAKSCLEQELAPISDIYHSPPTKLHLAKVLLERAMRDLLSCRGNTHP